MNHPRDNFLQRASDGFLPEPVRRVLWVPWFKVGPTDVNGWTAIHAAAGWGIGRLGAEFSTAQAIHGVWETFQGIAGDNRADLESTIDIGLDTLAFSVGWLISRINLPR